ncbi:MAG: FAD-dependent oxidoreductase, partial [Clostridiales bacterium]|nr:FAD-dependent oxidoreductase [Clostridiales bacterium]
SAKNVLIIGGGVAGMYAAITAAERGHKVTLTEKSDKLGGVLWFSETDKHKEDLKRYKDSLICRIKRLGVKVELGTEADAAYIEGKKADAVICAVGAEPVVPRIKGIENALHALTAYSDFDKLGQKIVIIGGGLIGCETGYLLADLGKTVHIIELLDDVAKDGNDSHRRALIPRMKKTLTWEVNSRCVEVTPNGVTVEDKECNQRFIDADTIIYAVGMKPKTSLVDSLRNSAAWFVPVGDCVSARRIEQAVYEGFMAAMDII